MVKKRGKINWEKIFDAKIKTLFIIAFLGLTLLIYINNLELAFTKEIFRILFVFCFFEGIFVGIMIVILFQMIKELVDLLKKK